MPAVTWNFAGVSGAVEPRLLRRFLVFCACGTHGGRLWRRSGISWIASLGSWVSCANESPLRDTSSDDIGIQVCFRSVKLAHWRVFPGRHLVASSTSGPPMMVPAQCRWGKRHSRGFIEHPISMKALGAKPLLVAMASTLPGIQVWFRLVKTCSAACASQPTFGRCSA